MIRWLWNLPELSVPPSPDLALLFQIWKWVYSENAHLLGNGGTGRKADYTTIGPLCGPNEVWQWVSYSGTAFLREKCVFIGHHRQYDEYRWIFTGAHPDFDPEKVAADTEKRWLAHSGERE